MEAQENYNASFTGSDGSVNHHQQHLLNPDVGENGEGRNSGMVVDYMLNSTRSPQPQRIDSGFGDVDRISFADVMQLSDFGPKLSPNQSKMNGGDGGIDPVYFLKFPVLSDRSQDALSVVPIAGDKNEIFNGFGVETKDTTTAMIEGDQNENEQMEEGGDARASDTTMVQLRLIGGVQKSGPTAGKNRRKRPRSMKSTEEVESQRMTHIAVERNRRKQMNEHLRVLRSLMPGSYVQRGDQASIIGGAIEFVRELEQLLQCLESQKRRRMFGGDLSQSIPIAQSETPVFQSLTLPNDQINILDFDGGGIHEETAENKSCLADVEVKLLGFDAMIKVLSRRRPGQLLKTIAALEDLQFNILHTNITTIEQTVLYSFNVKITAESRFTAEDIANSVQQIFGFIHASTI